LPHRKISQQLAFEQVGSAHGELKALTHPPKNIAVRGDNALNGWWFLGARQEALMSQPWPGRLGQD
jgi:hypothetical protein